MPKKNRPNFPILLTSSAVSNPPPRTLKIFYPQSFTSPSSTSESPQTLSKTTAAFPSLRSIDSGHPSESIHVAHRSRCRKKTVQTSPSFSPHLRRQFHPSNSENLLPYQSFTSPSSTSESPQTLSKTSAAFPSLRSTSPHPAHLCGLPNSRGAKISSPLNRTPHENAAPKTPASEIILPQFHPALPLPAPCDAHILRHHG